MPRKAPLPTDLGTIFSTADARRARVTAGRLRSRDLAHPYRGVNATALPGDIDGVARAVCARMSGAWAFSHGTAALLHRMPVPIGLSEQFRTAHVAVQTPRTAPVAEGLVGHKIRPGDVRVVRRNGMPVVSPADTWCQLASQLTREDLVAAGDFLLSGDPYEGARRTALCTRADLEAAADRYRGKRGARNVRWALERVRADVGSRPESLLRLLLVAAGLPEPVVHPPILVDEGELLLHPDLGLIEYRTLFEYLGDDHRREAWLKNIARNERLRAAGWNVIEVTSDDLFKDREAFLRRVSASLRRAGYRGRP